MAEQDRTIKNRVATAVEKVYDRVEEMNHKKRAALTATIVLSILHLAFLFLGATPARAPADWDNLHYECVWPQNQVDAIRVSTWLTVPLWIFEMLFPMFLFGKLRESDYYKLGVFVFVLVNMLMTVSTAVPAVLFSVGGCETEHHRTVLCWFAVVANIMGVSVAHFQGGDD